MKKWEISEGHGDNGEWEASIYSEDGTICRMDDEMIDCKANAHLIAAAPDLLEALERIIRWLNGPVLPWPTIDDKVIERAVKIANTAISKAKGI